MRMVRAFLADEGGAVTIDWVALTSGILLLGIAVIYGIFNTGVASTVGNINGALSGITIAGTGDKPDLTGGLTLMSGVKLSVGTKLHMSVSADSPVPGITSYTLTATSPNGTTQTLQSTTYATANITAGLVSPSVPNDGTVQYDGTIKTTNSSGDTVSVSAQDYAGLI